MVSMAEDKNLRQSFSFSHQNNNQFQQQMIPQTKSTTWKFENIDAPTNYGLLSRRTRRKSIKIDQRNLGSGFASHWVNVKPATASLTVAASHNVNNNTTNITRNNKIQQAKQIDNNMNMNNNNPNIVVQTVSEVVVVQPDLYGAMFEALVGRAELHRIEKQYKARKLLHKPRARALHISELIN
jgi:hypothetical protein